MKQKIKVGTRESVLAVRQTELVLCQIQARHPEVEFELVKMKTSGDLILDRTLDKVGGKGLFIKELEAALLENRIDLAVHSMKDLPAQIAPSLTIKAVTAREDPRDVLLSRLGETLERLPLGARVGTSSLRREKQLLQQRPDLEIVLLRGNVLTRIDKLLAGQYDAIVLAAAGLKRLGLEDKITQYFAIEVMLPAVCQGILAVQIRDDHALDAVLQSVHSEEAAYCASAERAFMVELDGGCTTPIAAHAVLHDASITLHAMLARADAATVWRDVQSGPKEAAAQLGVSLARRIVAQAGGKA